ncbi:MAG TPA: DUF2309 domain-containing protein, partial [Steroidobacteraceae bacterium]|nr:DUF2309 domain-containing protein [Steroidobacteraceae bacterium]
LALRLLLQRAYDYASERELLGRLVRPAGATDASTSRKTLQAAFCIDVRSEIYRRALEAQSDAIGTLGFAGFFGLAFEYVPLGHDEGRPHCPVLLEPGTVIRETIADRSDATHAASQRRGIHDRLTRLWRTFRSSAVSSFVYVETLGFASAGKLLGSLLGRTRPVADPRTRGLKRSEADALRPSLVPIEDVPRPNGLEPQARVDAAAQLLGGMSLTRDFARIVLLVGHGSSTVNNPHGAGLDCGACGGHSGESNAQLAAALLNDIDVRAGLRERGIAIPSDTWFIAGLHDTTTDAVTLYDIDRAPAELASDLERAAQWLRGASHQARLERAARLGLAADASADARIAARSRDWSQVRPEWGLAGCSAFIAAPRSRTAGVDLGGRAFLHEYDWQSDPDLGVLELIMSAPMVVASWINLQYYGSVVDNDAFGSGNKVLHNVVAGLGVLEGNAGDLRVGLPWQSIHDGREYAHEPRRLTVCLAAPVAAINRVIARNAEVRKLVDNGWVHVLAMPLEGGEWHRYRGGLQWDVLTAHASSAETPLGTAATAAAPQITA